MMITLFMHLIVYGSQKRIFGIGQNLKHLDLHIKMLENIEIYISAHLILRALKRYCKKQIIMGLGHLAAERPLKN